MDDHTSGQSISVSSTTYEKQDQIQIACFGRSRKNSTGFARFGIHIRTGLYQFLDDFPLATGNGSMDRQT